MEMRNGMVVWAPTDTQMNEIRRRVSKERAKAAADFFNAVASLFRGDRASDTKTKHMRTECPAGT